MKFNYRLLCSISLFALIFQSFEHIGKSESIHHIKTQKNISRISKDEFMKPTSILLEYEDNYIDSEFSPFNRNSSHLEKLKRHYKIANSQFISNLPDLSFDNVFSSDIGPFIELRYDISNSALRSDLLILENEDLVWSIYDTEDDYDDSGSTEFMNNKNYSEEYPLSEALTDIGINECEYTGNGIKIGSIEEGIPGSFINLSNTKYHTYGSNKTLHCFVTSSIYGGRYGIAPEAELYFADATNHGYLEVTNWLIENEVDIINQSAAYDEDGEYNRFSAYADYLVYHTGITYVSIAGNNNYENHRLASTGLGTNVISVSASGANKGVMYNTGYIETSAFVEAKPNFLAPGGYITEIPNINTESSKYKTLSKPQSGTSLSAPFVTGVIALLMEEFPDLIKHPEVIISLLQASTTKAKNQSTIYDPYSGFGLINYENARAAYDNSKAISFSGKFYKDSVLYESSPIEIDSLQTININFCLLQYSAHLNPADSSVNSEFCTMQVSLIDMTTFYRTTNGVVLGNISYLQKKSRSHNKIYQIRIESKSEGANASELSVGLTYIVS